MNSDFMGQFRDAFLDESTELVDTMERVLLNLNPSRLETEDLHTLFRAAHSIKGNASTFGFPAIAVFTHDLENCLEKVRSGAKPVTTVLVELLLKSVDLLRQHLSLSRENKPVPPGLRNAQEQLVANLNPDLWETSKPPSSAPCDAPGLGYQIRFTAPADTFRRGIRLERIFQDLEILGPTRFQLVTEGLPSPKAVDPETCYLAWDIQVETTAKVSEIEDIFEFVMDPGNLKICPLVSVPGKRLSSDALEEITAPAKPRVTEGVTLRISAEKIDALVDLVGEMVTTQGMLLQSSQSLQRAGSGQTPFEEAMQLMDRQMRELQRLVMGVRMVPVEQVFSRFPRLVRDLGQQLGKDVELVLEGQNTELDKSFIEHLVDPLTHLVRNALDHGLESPDERSRNGKPPKCRLVLHAASRGGQILIEVQDDGRGLDRERILSKAQQQGLSLPSNASDAEVFELLFTPGFSTVEVISEISGRGVGLDVVRQNIHFLGGRIEVESRLGRGSTFRLILPLTLVILDGLIVRIGDGIFVMPLVSVLESIVPKAADIQTIEGSREVFPVRGRFLPVLRLHEILGTSPLEKSKDPSRNLLVVVESGGNRAALLVDELVGQQQVVIKSLETHYRRVPGISGATILGDGHVALILDIQTLLQSHGESGS